MNVMKTIQEKMEQELRTNFPDGGTEQAIVKKMEAVLMHALAHLFTKCSEHIMETKSLQMNGRELSSYEEDKLEDHVSQYQLLPKQRRYFWRLSLSFQNLN